jgi:leucyl/phenylalanyl-tRNA--protein transferase
VTVYRLSAEIAFPDPRRADPDGLLAVGGDLRPERLLLAYALGIFPWYEKEPILWHSPDPRWVIEPARLHVPRRLLRTLRQGVFELHLDRSFGSVIRACAGTKRADQPGTWITPAMVEAYERLHELGFAHSAEAWQGGELVGGVYGVSLGAAFFGESMFFRRRDASKAALVALAWHLEAWGFAMLDCQVHTSHLERFEAKPWPRERFLAELARALQAPTRPGPWRLDAALLRARLAARVC